MAPTDFIILQNDPRDIMYWTAYSRPSGLRLAHSVVDEQRMAYQYQTPCNARTLTGEDDWKTYIRISDSLV